MYWYGSTKTFCLKLLSIQKSHLDVILAYMLLFLEADYFRTYFGQTDIKKSCEGAFYPKSSFLYGVFVTVPNLANADFQINNVDITISLQICCGAVRTMKK